MPNILTETEIKALREAVLDVIAVLRKQAASGNRDAARILLQYGLANSEPDIWRRDDDE